MATAKEALEVEATMRDRFTAGLTRVGRGVTSFTKRATGQFGRLVSVITSVRGLLLGLGGALVVRSLSRMITETVDVADSFGKLSDRLGESVEWLSKMAFVAERSGVEFNTLATGIQRLERRAAEFRNTGAGPIAGALDILGDEIRDAVEAGESMEQLFPKLAKAMTQIEDPQQRVLAAMKLFDTDGVKNVQLLNSEFEELIETAKRLGFEITTLQARDAAEFNNALTDLRASSEGLKRTLVLDLAPALTEIFESITTWIQENKAEIIGFFKEDIPGAVQGTVSAVEEIGLALNQLEYDFLSLQEAALKLSFAGDVLMGPAFGPLTGQGFRARALGGTQSRREELRTKIGVAGALEDLDVRMSAAGMQWSDKYGWRGAGTGPSAESESVRRFREAVERSERETLAERGGFIGPPMEERVSLPRVLEDTRGAAEGAAEGLRAVVERTRDFEIMADAVVGLAGSFSNTLGGAIEGFILNTENAGQVFERFIDGVLRDMARAGSQMVSNALIGALFRVVGGALAGGAVGGFMGAEQLPGSALAGSTFETSTGSFMQSIGAASFQGGGLVRGTRPQAAILHPPEAVVQTHQGAIPVDIRGRGGGLGPTYIVNIRAMDSRDVSRWFLEGAMQHRDLIARVVAERFQDSPAYREQWG